MLAGFFLGSPRVRTPAAAGAREFLASNAALAIPADRSREAVVLHLTEVARRVGPGFRDRPLEEARARLALGRRFSEVASWDAVATQAARARDLLETQERTGSHEYAEALVQLGNAQIRNAQGVDETLFERAIAIEERREAPDPLTLGDAFSGLAMRHSSGNRPGLFKQAESEWARAFSWYERLRGPVHGRMLARLNYARMKARLGEFEASAVSYRRAIEEQRALPAMPSQEVGIVTGEYGDVLISLARWPEAEATLRRAIADRGEAHDYFLPICWSRLGTVVLQRGDAAEARRLFHTAIEMRLGILAAEVPDEPQFGEFRNRLAHRGLEPRDVVPLVQLLRRHAPTVTAGFRFTTLEVARAEEALGHASAAAALRHEVETLSHLPAEELPRQ